MISQDFLRKQVKIAKALNDDIYYKDFAEYLGITEHSFYNWLHCYYELNSNNANKLYDIIVDLVTD